MKASSVEALHSQNHWNPFAAQDDDTISDDVMFGQEFDRLRCGSQSSEYNFFYCKYEEFVLPKMTRESGSTTPNCHDILKPAKDS